jgi:ATP-dependent RNA helicase DeaD
MGRVFLYKKWIWYNKSQFEDTEIIIYRRDFMNAMMALGIAPEICNVLKKEGIVKPTKIQEAAIPSIFKKFDVIGQSETGTGKTLAYLLPALQRVDPEKGTQVLIMVPTRELARQIFDVLKPLALACGVDAADLIGGRTITGQLQKLKREPNIIIGTPGRLLDHEGRGSLHLSEVQMVILDEADQMLAHGFRKEIESLIDETPKKRQLLMFSATMPEEARRLARKYMKKSRFINTSMKATASTVEQRVYEVEENHKFNLLVKQLKAFNPFMAVVFCNTKEEARELSEKLSAAIDFPIDEIDGDMSQGQRNQVIREFEKARIQVLVASDLAARGLDVEGITHVFNWDIPHNLEYYTHRIGRTGRAGTKGMAITYATPQDGELLRRLEHSIQETISRYSEDGKLLRVRKARPRKKVVTPGMYKPTKKKEHKALGHRGRDMRRKRKPGEQGGRRKRN